MSPSMTIAISLLPPIVILILTWYFRNWIQRWATKRVEHRYDAKLEGLKSSLKKTEEEFKSELQRKEKEIEALRSPAMQMLVSQRNSLSAKKIEAYDLLWDCVHRMHPYKMAAQVMQRINIEEVCKKEFLDEKTQKFFSSFYALTNLEKMPAIDAHRVRPYVSQTCWAKFAAYSAIGGYASAILIMFKSGLTKQELLNKDSLKTLISVALPHQIPLLDQLGITASFYLMDELEESILNEVRAELQGTNEIDDVARAKKIVDAANQLSIQSTNIPATIDPI